MLAAYFETDDVPFTLSTDSLPGVTRSYQSFSAAAHEVSDSRVFAGIHWRFDVTAGEDLGYEVGNYIATNWLLPVRPHTTTARPVRRPGPQPPAVPGPLGHPSRGDHGLCASRPRRPTRRTPRCSALPDEAAAPVFQPALQRRAPGRFPAGSPLT